LSYSRGSDVVVSFGTRQTRQRPSRDPASNYLVRAMDGVNSADSQSLESEMLKNFLALIATYFVFQYLSS
jgi:hypothetical protein